MIEHISAPSSGAGSSTNQSPETGHAAQSQPSTGLTPPAQPSKKTLLADFAVAFVDDDAGVLNIVNQLSALVGARTFPTLLNGQLDLDTLADQIVASLRGSGKPNWVLVSDHNYGGQLRGCTYGEELVRAVSKREPAIHCALLSGDSISEKTLAEFPDIKKVMEKPITAETLHSVIASLPSIQKRS